MSPTSPQKPAVLLVNLGSPDHPEEKAVGRYLREFLMDRYVIDVPYLLRYFLVNFIIVPRRAGNSATLYQKIWTAEGSPLIFNTENLARKVGHKLNIPVIMAMRYGEPAIATAVQQLHNMQITDLYVVPLYPQYAMSTTLTVNKEVTKQLARLLPGINLTTAPPFYRDEDYLRVLTGNIRSQLAKTSFDHLLFSYHGVPERHLRKTDPTGNHCLINQDCCQVASEAHAVCYKHQCLVTTERVAQALGLPAEQYSISFQSRLGKDPWIQPYTTDTLKKLAAGGVKKLAVVTPAFVSDCLETIEEIGEEAREDFLAAGGSEFYRITCLNDDDNWVDTLVNWSKKALNLP